MSAMASIAKLAAARLIHCASPSRSGAVASAWLRSDLLSHPFWRKWLADGAPPFAPGFLASEYAAPSRFALASPPIFVRSTGTENPESVFPISNAEAASWGACAWGFAQSKTWLGLMPRIALILKNDSDMYRRASPRLSFHKLPADASATASDIARFSPDAIAGPSEALRRIALRWPKGAPPPKLVVCGAEILWRDQTHDMLSAWPGARIAQFYQCAEGLLGHGDSETLAFQAWSGLVERRQIGRYFSPVRTDFWRRASPVVRAEISDALEELPGGRIVHHGRASHLFETSTGTRVSARSAFEDLFQAHGRGLGRAMRAIQLEDGSIRIEAENAPFRDPRFEFDCARAAHAAGFEFAGIASHFDSNLLDAKTNRGVKTLPRAPVGIFIPQRKFASLFGAAP